MSESDKPTDQPGGWHKKKRGGRKKRHENRPTTTPPPAKFQGGKDVLDGNYFDCTGYGQSDRFVKTVQKIADYVGQEYKNGGVTRTEVMTQTAVTIPLPARPTTTRTTNEDGDVTTHTPDVLDISDYQNAKKIADFKIQNQLENRQKVFSLVWQQCTESMHAKVQAHRDFTKIEAVLDGIELLRVIKLVCFNIEDEKYIPQKVHEAKAAFYSLKQGRDTDQAYQVKFLNAVQIIEQCGASLGEDPLIRGMVCEELGLNPATKDTTNHEKIAKRVRDYTLGTALLLGADPDRYGGMLRGLKNASLAGRDEWPKSATDAYSYLSKWEGDNSNSNRAIQDYEGTAFVNETREAQPWHANMICRKCNKKGHIAEFCRSKKTATVNAQVVEQEEADTTNVNATQQLLDAFEKDEDIEDYYADLFLCETEHVSASFQVKDGVNGGRIPKEWILLDSQSTTDAYSNPDLLRDIHEVKGSLTIHTQAGKAVTKLRGTVPGYGKVWYCPNGIANILSLANVAKTHTVTFNLSLIHI